MWQHGQLVRLTTRMDFNFLTTTFFVIVVNSNFKLQRLNPTLAIWLAATNNV